MKPHTFSIVFGDDTEGDFFPHHYKLKHRLIAQGIALLFIGYLFATVVICKEDWLNSPASLECLRDVQGMPVSVDMDEHIYAALEDNVITNREYGKLKVFNERSQIGIITDYLKAVK